nr:hypothetical protein [Tanacetum cinerariifolium]
MQHYKIIFNKIVKVTLFHAHVVHLKHLDGHIEEVKGMLTDCGGDMHCQFLEILRSLLDSFSQVMHGTVSKNNSSVDVYRRIKPDQATRCIEKGNERRRTHVTEVK